MDKKLGTCEDCAIGFYQERDAQVECVKCPPGTSTTEVRTDNSSSCLGTVFNFACSKINQIVLGMDLFAKYLCVATKDLKVNCLKYISDLKF